jgi:hypothetical protein
MTAIDFNLHSDYSADHDVVIVGAGAAGLYLAAQLSAFCRVLVVGSGGFEESSEKQSLNIVEQTGKELTAAVDGRKRAIGGTTIAWGGQSLPFAKSDFECREWVAPTGWPLTFEELQPHYQNANRAMGIDALDYEEDVFKYLHFPRPAFDPEKIRFHFSKWAPQPNFRKIYRRSISDAFTVLFNCQFVDVDLRDRAIKAVVLANFNGARRSIKCNHLVIAAGGLEVAVHSAVKTGVL